MNVKRRTSGARFSKREPQANTRRPATLEARAFARLIVCLCRKFACCFEPPPIGFVCSIVLVDELPTWPLPLVAPAVVLLATKPATSGGPFGDPRPVAVFALVPSEPDPKRNPNK